MRCRRLVLAVAAAGALLAGGLSFATAASATTTDLCVNSGSGACLAQGSLNVQEELGAPKAEFNYGDQGTVHCTNSCWPFAEGTGYNTIYNGDTVYTFQDNESGDCLQAYNASDGIQVREIGECASSSFALWVVDGAWLINVGSSDSHSGQYPYSEVMTTGCASSGCKDWLDESTSGHSVENAWGT